MNIIKKYFDFKYKFILNLYEEIYGVFEEEFENKTLNTLIDTYISSFYFHHLETIYEEDFKNYNLSLVIKELEGKKEEILYEIYDNRGLKHIASDIRKNLMLPIEIDMNYFKGDVHLEKIYDKYDFKASDKILEIIKNYQRKEEKFFDTLEDDTFNLIYKKIKNKNDYYLVELSHSVDYLYERYKEESVFKNFSSRELEVLKFETTLNIFSLELIKKFINHEKKAVYFLKMPDSLLKDDDIKEILNKVYDNKLESIISFLVDYKSYLTNKRILNKLDPKYSFSALIDMSHINNPLSKMETIDDIKLFDYGLLDNIKKTDYEVVMNYEVNFKKIFSLEFEGE